MASPIEVLLCYAEEDELQRKELARHLGVLKRQDIINFWHDRQISAGTERVREIDKAVEELEEQSSDIVSTICTLEGHAEAVTSITISPDAQTLASGSWDKTIKIWHLYTGQLLHTLTGHSDYVNSVAISPDGQALASGSQDTTIKLWNLHTGQLLRTLMGHSESVYSIVISPDGQTLVSGSGDNTVKVWNLQTGQVLRTLTEYSDEVRSVAFGPDGRAFASGSYDGTIKIWGNNGNNQITINAPPQAVPRTQ